MSLNFVTIIKSTFVLALELNTKVPLSCVEY